MAIHEMLTGIAHSLPRELEYWYGGGPYFDAAGQPDNFQRLQLAIGGRVEKLADALDEVGGGPTAKALRSSFAALLNLMERIHSRLAATRIPHRQASFRRILSHQYHRVSQAFVSACDDADCDLESGAIDVAGMINVGRKVFGGRPRGPRPNPNAERARKRIAEIKESGQWRGNSSADRVAKDAGYSTRQAMYRAIKRLAESGNRDS